jgi:hypothetical protein
MVYKLYTPSTPVQKYIILNERAICFAKKYKELYIMKVTFITGSGNLVLSNYKKIEMSMITGNKSWK